MNWWDILIGPARGKNWLRRIRVFGVQEAPRWVYENKSRNVECPRTASPRPLQRAGTGITSQRSPLPCATPPRLHFRRRVLCQWNSWPRSPGRSGVGHPNPQIEFSSTQPPAVARAPVLRVDRVNIDARCTCIWPEIQERSVRAYNQPIGWLRQSQARRYAHSSAGGIQRSTHEPGVHGWRSSARGDGIEKLGFGCWNWGGEDWEDPPPQPTMAARAEMLTKRQKRVFDI